MNRNPLISPLALLIAAGVAVLGATPALAKPCDAKACTFTVLHTNDTHGHFMPDAQGQGGMAAQKTVIDGLRSAATAAKSDVLVLSAGDVNTGVLASDLLQAIPDITAMNAIGYDAMVVGHHEFDHDLVTMVKQRKLAKFPFLAANIYDMTTRKRYFRPYDIFSLPSGLRVAVIGLTAPETSRLSNPSTLEDFIFKSPVDELTQQVKQLRKANAADVFIALTHLGYDLDGQNPADSPGDVTLAKAMPPKSLDMIIGGHSHHTVCMQAPNQLAAFKAGDSCQPDEQNGVLIMQAGDNGRFVGQAEFSYLRGKLELVNYRLVLVNQRKPDGSLVGKAVSPDKALKATLTDFQAKAATAFDQVIATTTDVFQGNPAAVRSQQTNFGRLLGTAAAKTLQADMAIVPAQLFQRSLPAGDITARHIAQALPSEYTFNRISFDGAGLVAYLGKVASMPAGTPGYAQIAGVNMQVDCSTQQAVVQQINGEPFNLNAKKQYTVAVPSAHAKGAAGYPVQSSLNVGALDATVLINFLKKQHRVSAAPYLPQWEVTYINSASPFGCQ